MKDPYSFWWKIAGDFDWQTKPTQEKFLDYNFDVTKGDISVKWMEDGVTNICHNCLDRHLEKKGDQVREIVSTLVVLFDHGSRINLLCH